MDHCRVDLDGCYYCEWKFSPVGMTILESPFLVQWNGPEFDLLYQLRRFHPRPPPRPLPRGGRPGAGGGPPRGAAGPWGGRLWCPPGPRAARPGPPPPPPPPSPGAPPT